MKKIVLRLLSIVIFAVIFIGCGEVWRYILVDDTNSYTRVAMHQLYHSDQNIDVLFIGSSHVYRSVVPEIMDAGLGEYTFNGGTSSQDMDGSLAVLKEAAACHQLKQVYLELYYDMAGNNHDQRTQLTDTYIISDYMKPSLNRIHYLLQAGSKEHWVNSFILARRNWSDFFDSDYVRELVEKKSQASYKNYEWIRREDQVEYYVDRGFVANESVIQEGNFWNKKAYGNIDKDYEKLVATDWYKSLKDIVKYCDDHNIELTFFVAPEPEWTLAGKEDYGVYYSAISEISEELNVELWDFNLIKSEYFDTMDRTLFMDEDHLNKNGAMAFSTLLSKVAAGKLSSKDIFYDSYDDKIKEEGICFYGIAGPYDNANIKNCRIITGKKDQMEFCVIATPDEKDQYVVQDFSTNLSFDLALEEHGILTIVGRKIEDIDSVQTFEFEY